MFCPCADQAWRVGPARHPVRWEHHQIPGAAGSCPEGDAASSWSPAHVLHGAASCELGSVTGRALGHLSFLMWAELIIGAAALLKCPQNRAYKLVTSVAAMDQRFKDEPAIKSHSKWEETNKCSSRAGQCPGGDNEEK